MDDLFRLTRRGAILSVSALTLGLGVALVYLLITPENVRTLRTSTLLIVLALFVLPVMSMVALWFDRVAMRKARKALAVPRSESTAAPKRAPGREVSHPARPRESRTERRRTLRTPVGIGEGA